jgi:hypothetical protein
MVRRVEGVDELDGYMICKNCRWIRKWKRKISLKPGETTEYESIMCFALPHPEDISENREGCIHYNYNTELYD